MLTGKKVIIRTFSAGVHFGTLVERSGKEVLLSNAKRIWSWTGANTLHEVATEGVGVTSKVSSLIKVILLTEVIEILPCEDKAISCLEKQGWESKT